MWCLCSMFLLLQSVGLKALDNAIDVAESKTSISAFIKTAVVFFCFFIQNEFCIHC